MGNYAAHICCCCEILLRATESQEATAVAPVAEPTAVAPGADPIRGNMERTNPIYGTHIVAVTDAK